MDRAQALRGANWVYLANGVFSLAVYRSGQQQLVRNLRGTLHDEYADADGQWYTGEHIVSLTITFSAMSIAAAGLNLIEDTCLGSARFHGLAMWLPLDRHFRLLTLLKATLLWLKMELLVFTCFSCEGEMVLWLLTGQLLSVLFTSVVACISTISMFGLARKIESFRDQYRRPQLLWTSAMVCLLMLTLVNSVMMVSKVFGEDSTLIALLHERGCVGILLNLGQTYYFPFFCMGNEAALSISSKASNPQVFAGLDSPRGVWVWSVYVAAKFPMEILVNCVECQFLTPSYFSNLFLFGNTWVEPMYGYATLVLVVAGVTSYLACGGDGVVDWPRARESSATPSCVARSVSFGSSLQGLDPTPPL